MKVDGRTKVDAFKSVQSFVGSSILIISAWFILVDPPDLVFKTVHFHPHGPFNLTFDTPLHTSPRESLKIRLFQNSK